VCAHEGRVVPRSERSRGETDSRTPTPGERAAAAVPLPAAVGRDAEIPSRPAEYLFRAGKRSDSAGGSRDGSRYREAFVGTARVFS
jgi:hypothetical protein